MKGFILKVYRFFLVIYLTSSCRINQYIPNTQNVPLFKEKGTIQGQMSFTNFQAGYSLTDHLAVVGNYFHKDRTGTDGHFLGMHFLEGTSLTKYRANDRSVLINEGETGIGIFNKNNSLIYELYIGAGYGETTYHHEYSLGEVGGPFNYSYYFNAKSLKFYIQPNIGICLNRSELAFSTKFLIFRYTNIYWQKGGNADFDDVGLPYDLILNNTNTYDMYFLQPAFTYKQSITNYLKFQMQIGGSCFLNKNVSNLNFKGMFFDFGIGLTLSELFKK